METMVAVQDLRTSLAAIADRAAKGESFLVMRNSRPAFRIVPATQPVAGRRGERGEPLRFGELRAGFQASGLSRAMSKSGLETMIHEVHDGLRGKAR